MKTEFKLSPLSAALLLVMSVVSSLQAKPEGLNVPRETDISKLDSDLSVLSPTLAPEVFTEAATDVTTSSATLNGTVNAKNLETQVWFEYDTTSGRYRRATPKKTISGSGDTLISIDITDLSAEPIYYYRVVAQNKAGITYGRQVTFTPCIDYYEPNDSFTTAYGPLLSGNSYNGKICYPSDVDYYGSSPFCVGKNLQIWQKRG